MYIYIYHSFYIHSSIEGDERTKLVSELPANESTTEFTLISAETDITRTKGETTKIIIGMDSASATGLAFDDVAIELPYSSLRVRDIAVSSVDQLDDIDTVSIVYGDSFISETGVEWNITDDNAHVVYGTTDIDGVTARAVITGSGITVNVVSDGVTKTETELEYGKAVTLSSGSKLAFMIDDETHLNLISAAAGDKQPAKTSDVTAAMRVIDNGNGITIEGIIKECAGDDEVILIYDKNGNIVNAVYAELSADGSYSVTAGLPADGEYKAVMTDTLAAFEFAYAGVQSFEELRAKISSGVSLSTLFDTGADAADNRIILGASGFAMLDKLSASDKSDVYTLFKNELGNKSRAEAAALFDALVTVKAADSAVSVSEWSVMLENSSEALGIKDTNVYNMYAEMSDTDKKSVKSKTDSQNLVSAEEFAKAFAGSVINTALLNAGYYTNIQQILKDNAEWFGINVSSVSSAAAKYILNNVNAGQTSIDSLTKLINTAISNSSSSAVSGGGGGGGSSSGGGSGISGTNLGPYTAQSANTDTTAADSASTVPSNRFNDLSGYDWAENAIYGLFDRDIVDGYGDGTFRPAGNVTREAFVKLIVTAFGVDAAEETKEFSDVTADRWSHDYIQRAAAAGIVTGVTDDSFMSEADITRQDAAVMIYRALLYKGKNLSAGELTFTDRADISEYAADAVAALSGLGIINGMDDGNFSPRNMTSRAQAAVMIYRVISTLF